MSIIELDDRGLLLTCPQCGQRNRLLYERLGKTFRWGKCHTELGPPDEPIAVKSETIFDRYNRPLRPAGPGRVLGSLVWTVQNGGARIGEGRRRGARPMAGHQSEH